MSNINFVPDDYVQSNESRRANLMCLVLFSVVMAALGGSFFTIKIRQKACGERQNGADAGGDSEIRGVAGEAQRNDEDRADHR
jgi:hypothetical protein